jgi:hypothetical protein
MAEDADFIVNEEELMGEEEVEEVNDDPNKPMYPALILSGENVCPFIFLSFENYCLGYQILIRTQ